jgi:hypothetical protein
MKVLFLQVVVSDHGMTETGNHGGSSYEETDSLALFVGHSIGIASHGKNANNEVSQVYLTICFLEIVHFYQTFELKSISL